MSAYGYQPGQEDDPMRSPAGGGTAGHSAAPSDPQPLFRVPEKLVPLRADDVPALRRLIVMLSNQRRLWPFLVARAVLAVVDQLEDLAVFRNACDK